MERALVHEVETGFVAVEEGELGGGGLLFEGSGDAGYVVAGGLGGEGIGKQGILNGPGAAETPIGGGHLLDHAELDAVGGIKALDVLREQFGEGFPGFTGKHDAIGEQSVTNGVERRAAPTLGRLWSAGEEAVRTGREDTTEGRHKKKSKGKS